MKQITKNNLIIFGLLPFILGLITSFSLPPYNLILINFITFPTLLFIVFELKKSNKNIKVFFKVGWLFGFGYFLSNLYWITYSLTHDDIFKIFIPISLILIPAFLAIFYGLSTLLLFKFNYNKKITLILVFSLIFSILEFLRGNILTGFPWNLIAFSWSSSLSSLQILSLIGTYSFNLVSITIFSLPFVFFFKNYKKTKIFITFFLLITISLNYFYGFQILKKKDKINLISSDYVVKIISPTISIDRFVKNIKEDKILNDLIELSDPEKDKKTIFIWPEGVLPNIYLNELKKYKNEFSTNFSSNHLIILGINDYKDKIYNSLVVLNHELKVIDSYNKNKLVPFGEFLPFEKFLTKMGLKKITYGYESFSKGKERKIIELKNVSFDFKLLPLICYEIIYSGQLKGNSNNYDFIINLSEDGWFGQSIGPEQHFVHAIFRSIEEGKNIIRSANNGFSALIDPYGDVINKIESTQKGVIEVKNFQNTKKTLFSIIGNKMFFYFILFYISLIFLINKSEKE